MAYTQKSKMITQENIKQPKSLEEAMELIKQLFSMTAILSKISLGIAVGTITTLKEGLKERLHVNSTNLSLREHTELYESRVNAEEPKSFMLIKA